MKKLNIIIALMIALFIVQSCGSSEVDTQEVEEINEIDEAALMNLGDSITMHAQQVLMSNVANAMQEGGSIHAVDFCNVEAMLLTDSLSKLHGVTIQRVSDKNRNPQNSLATSMDVGVWEKVKAAMASESGPKQFMEEENGSYFYYKPIVIAMPTCLSCHGNESDIDVATQKLIVERYPEDKALDYQMGDLRGLWKVKFETP